MLFAWCLVIAGLVLLLIGGDSLVRGSVALARRAGVSPLLIGITLVGFGTSTPELLTSIQAVLADSPGVSLGNVVGSNISNCLLILGVAAVLFPIACDRRAFLRDGTVLVLATVLSIVVMLDGIISATEGVVSLLALLAYILFTYLAERDTHDPSEQLHELEADMIPSGPPGLWKNLGFTVGGIALTMLGAKFLVDGAVTIARGLQISESVIGLSIVAVGTSLPELAAAVSAAFRRHSDVVLGNVIGSNIYNLLAILGITALVKPLSVPDSILTSDIWIMLIVTLLTVVCAISSWTITRREGVILLVGFVAYLGNLALHL